MTREQHESQSAPIVSLFRGGDRRLHGSDDDTYRRLSEAVGQLLQVKHLALFMGAGASFHLGLPQIRRVSIESLLEMVKETGAEITETQSDLLHLIFASGEKDLEKVISILSTALSFSRASGQPAIHLSGNDYGVDEVKQLLLTVNRSLAAACDIDSRLPPSGHGQSSDMWRVHREMLRRLLGSRRGDLPRVRIFTTNYDVAVERTLDDAGIPYFDGFSGTLVRTFRPETYERDLYLPPPPEERRLSRVSEVLYLYKVHGSINWRAAQTEAGIDTDVVVQASSTPLADDELALIYPTPEKDSDTLGFPYSELLRSLAQTLTRPETALLVLGYGFADDHINRLLLQPLLSSSTFQLFIVDPRGVLDESSEADESSGQFRSDTVAGRLAGIRDHRISVLTGEAATFENFSTLVMPDPDLLASQEGLDDELRERLAEALSGSQTAGHVPTDTGAERDG